MGYVISIANGTTLRTAKASERSPPLDRLTSSKRASRLGGGHRQEYGETCLTARQASEAFLGAYVLERSKSCSRGQKASHESDADRRSELGVFFFIFVSVAETGAVFGTAWRLPIRGGQRGKSCSRGIVVAPSPLEATARAGDRSSSSRLLPLRADVGITALPSNLFPRQSFVLNVDAYVIFVLVKSGGC